MKVLSLFDGMACGMLAMLGAGVKVDRYVAYEIDKYATQTSAHNFPEIEHRGDVFKADFTEFAGFDFLVGGSPCTYWSIAQKNNRETEASGLGWELFSQYVRALHEAKPRYFVYENNKSMSDAIRESITKAFGFEPICINSALVSAQYRQRLYWVGKRETDGTYSKVDVSQPADRGIILRDILEDAPDEQYYQMTTVKARPVVPDAVEKPKRVCAWGKYADGKTQQGMRAYSIDGKSVTLKTTGAEKIAIPVRVGDIGSNAQAHRVYSCNGKSVTINAGGGGQGGKTGLYLTPLVGFTTGAYPAEYLYQVVNGLITINGQQYPTQLPDGLYVIRKLTVTECNRVQTVPDWYEFPVSNAQAYKMLGNGWTVEVIKHLILSALIDPDDSWML